MFRPEESEAMDFLSWLGILNELCHSLPDGSFRCVAQHPAILSIGVGE